MTTLIRSSRLFESFNICCKEHTIDFHGNCSGFGMIFKDNVPLDECGIKKVILTGKINSLLMKFNFLNS